MVYLPKHLSSESIWSQYDTTLLPGAPWGHYFTVVSRKKCQFGTFCLGLNWCYSFTFIPNWPVTLGACASGNRGGKHSWVAVNTAGYICEKGSKGKKQNETWKGEEGSESVRTKADTRKIEFSHQVNRLRRAQGKGRVCEDEEKQFFLEGLKRTCCGGSAGLHGCLHSPIPLLLPWHRQETLLTQREFTEGCGFPPFLGFFPPCFPRDHPGASERTSLF